MNPITTFFLIMAILGLIDKFLNNRFGIGESFDSGSAILGEMMVFVMGVYALCVTVSTVYLDAIANATAGWSFDPSIAISSILAADMGAYPIATTIARDPAMGHFAGVAVGSTLGTLLSFYLPAYISSVKGRDIDKLIEGFLYGIVVLPVTLLISGLLFGVAPGLLLKNMLPIIVICAVLLFGLIKHRAVAAKVLFVTGKAATLIVYISFAAGLLSLCFPGHAVLDPQLVADTVVMVFRMTINMIGALVTMNILNKVFAKQFKAMAGMLGINEFSMMGILAGIPGGVAMIPLLPKMDEKGKVLNGAFAISGFYALGGQMALIAAKEPVKGLLIFFFAKFGGAVLAVLLASKMEKNAPDTVI